MAGASRVSPLCSPDSLSASWTAQLARCLGRQPCSPQEAWLLERHLPMPVGVEASAAVSTNSSTRAHLFRRLVFLMKGLSTASIRYQAAAPPVGGQYSATWEETLYAARINALETSLSLKALP